MSKLTYNTDIFTNVNKWDRNFSYYGVKVSGKLNQYNGQGYPILDAIDIDWNGAYVKTLNTYIYTTEELINCLNITYSNFENYVPSTYLTTIIKTLNEEIERGDAYSLTYTKDNISYVIGLINQANDAISHIQDITIDRSNYYKVDYKDIVKDGKLRFSNRRYYVYNMKTRDYDEVFSDFIINNPDLKYYFNIIDNVLLDMYEIQNINDFIGYSNYDPVDNTYTYTGLIEKLHNYDQEFEDIHNELNDVSNIANNAYSLAYTSYSYIDGLRRQVIINRDNIGYHTTYNIYKPINILSEDDLNNYLAQNNNKVYTFDNELNDYVISTYNNTYEGQYYVHYDVIWGTGIEREIELLQDQMYDNSYILYKLSVITDNPKYLDLTITPTTPGSPERTIRGNIIQSKINVLTGEATDGVITNSSLSDAFTYTFNWNILNKENN